MPGPSCKSCQYCRAESDAERATESLYCHRYPPTLVYLDSERTGEADWPRVHPEQWCGEWRWREPQP